MLSLSVVASAPLADSTASQVSTILNAIAPLLWVAVVLLAIVIFRKPLTSAIGRVSEVDVGTTKVVLQNQADSVANTTKKVIGAAHKPPTGAMAEAAGKATSDPPGSVLDAWSAVEDAVRAPAAEQVPGVISPSVPQVVNALTSSKGLDSSLVLASKTLESLRQMAAVNPKAITPATAKSFVSAADDLAQLITKAGSPAETQAGQAP